MIISFRCRGWFSDISPLPLPLPIIYW
jgi:hypothetical protein